MGWEWLKTGEKPGPIRKNKRLRRLAANAVQSAVFNRIVARRLEDRCFDEAILGDVLELHEGGLFRVKPDELDEGRALVRSRAATPTGPLWGDRVLRAEADADTREIEALEEFALGPEDFSMASREARGLRRAFTVRARDFESQSGIESNVHVLKLGFSLPSGAYATVVLREIMKNEHFDRG